LKVNRRASVRGDEAQKDESHMKQTAILTTASVLTILFMTFHMAGDILFKMSPPGFINLLVVFIFVVQLYGTLVLGGRRAGYIIILLGSALGLLIPVVHMKGTRGLIGGDIGTSGQAFLFVWTMLAMGVTATFTIILSASALWSLPWRRSRRASPAA
jgi:membrane-bound ClpP family serine protease